MEMTIEVPDEVVKRAAELELPVSTLIAQALDQIVESVAPEGFVRLGAPVMSRHQATEAIREIASRHTLGGLKIKDLIEEGRRL